MLSFIQKMKFLFAISCFFLDAKNNVGSRAEHPAAVPAFLSLLLAPGAVFPKIHRITKQAASGIQKVKP